MTTIFTRAELEQALDISTRAYRLLQWLEQAISRGFIRIDAAHDYTSFAATAQLWLERHYADIPADARPAREQLPAFANYFASYTHTFDLVEEPGKRLYSPNAHCFCPMCSWLVDIPHLRPKQLTPQHKQQAERMLLDHLHERALELGRLLEDDAARSLCYELHEPLALSVYAEQLRSRIAGETTGPAVLALWRMFAWTSKGSPKQGFCLDAGMMLDARARVDARLLSLPIA